MAVTFVDLDARYLPQSSTKSIEISVLIGNGQSGSYSIFLNQELKGVNVPTVIGTGDEIRDKRTLVTTIVRDVLKETNWTSMLVRVKEGGTITEFGPYSKEVPAHLDTCIYTLTIVHE